MPSHRAADNERWAGQGTQIFLGSLAGIDDDALAGPSGLEGWTERHLVAHVAANADALGNLVRWAVTGVETPMYSSPAQRTADIEAGAERPAAELRAWVAGSADQLAAGVAGLTPAQLAREVRTVQGRLVLAGEIAWLRAREVMVHAVDLAAGVTFADLPADFLAALTDDIVAKRSAASGPAMSLLAVDADRSWMLPGSGEPTTVNAPLAELAAYLAGRPSALDGTEVPQLPRWL